MPFLCLVAVEIVDAAHLAFLLVRQGEFSDVGFFFFVVVVVSIIVQMAIPSNEDPRNEDYPLGNQTRGRGNQPASTIAPVAQSSQEPPHKIDSVSVFFASQKYQPIKGIRDPSLSQLVRGRDISLFLS